MAAVPTIISAGARKLRLLLVLAVVASALLVPARARAGTSFTFYGSGYGDGVGLSQYGAYGMAAAGKSVTTILTHFYSGTNIGPAPSPPSVIRVGLLQNQTGIAITAQTTAATLNLGSLTGTTIAQIPAGATWTVQVISGQYWVKKADGTYVGNLGYGGATQALFVLYSSGGGSVYLPQTGHTYARGYIELNIYQPCSGCGLRLRAIQVLDVQGYLYGVAESPVDWPSVPQQVQAIASRSYALFMAATYGQHRGGCNCAVYSTTRDQYYVGSDRELSSYGTAWISAVDATNGQVVLYNGATAQAEFYSSSGGYTENVENVWGGTAVPYLRGVCDPGDYTTANPSRVWSVSMTGIDAEGKIKAYTGTDIGEVQSFTGITRGVSGRIISVTANGTSGSVTLSGWGFRSALGLRDDKVWINKNFNVQGAIRTTYDRANCAPGLPQSIQYAVTNGAYQVFAKGRIYYNSVTGKAYWLSPGPVLSKYLALGGNASFLGLPRSGVVGISSPAGQRTYFDGGRIYWSSATNAHELHGLVLTDYMNLGQWTSPLGYPTSDIIVVDSNHQKATFQNGTITCTLSTSTCT